MTEPQPEKPQGPPDSGVFGRLPRSRPGVRSPRRDQAEQRAKRTGPAPRPAASTPRPPATGSAPRPAQPPKPRATREPRPAPRAPEAPPARERQAGIEDLAWAGVTVAAEAATVGVKLVSRALEAVREAVERR